MKQPSQAQPAKKKPYQAPKLLVYGDLTQMTLAAGSKGQLDGGRILGRRRSGR